MVTYAREFASHKYKTPPPSEHQFRFADLNTCETGSGGGELDFGEKQQVVNRHRKFAEAVAPILSETVELFAGRHFREVPISLDAQGGIGDVASRNKSRHARFWPGLDELGLVRGHKIEPHFDFDAGPGAL